MAEGSRGLQKVTKSRAYEISKVSGPQETTTDGDDPPFSVRRVYRGTLTVNAI